MKNGGVFFFIFYLFLMFLMFLIYLMFFIFYVFGILWEVEGDELSTPRTPPLGSRGSKHRLP